MVPGCISCFESGLCVLVCSAAMVRCFAACCNVLIYIAATSGAGRTLPAQAMPLLAPVVRMGC